MAEVVRLRDEVALALFLQLAFMFELELLERRVQVCRLGRLVGEARLKARVFDRARFIRLLELPRGGDRSSIRALLCGISLEFELLDLPLNFLDLNFLV